MGKPSPKDAKKKATAKMKAKGEKPMREGRTKMGVGKPTKRTKKFHQKNLKATLETRKKQKIWKQNMSKKRDRLAAREGHRKADDEAAAQGSDDDEGEEEVVAEADDKDVEDFLERGFFEELEKESGDEDSEEEEEEDNDDDDDDEDEDEVESGEGEESDDDAEEEVEEDHDGEEDASADEMEDEAAGHKDTLEKLKQKDPEFFKYLQENDASLLDFDLSDEEPEAEEGPQRVRKGKKGTDEDDAEDEEDLDEEAGPAGGNRKALDADMGDDDDEDAERCPELTLAKLKSIIANAEKGNAYNPIRDLVRAFDCACHVDDAPDKDRGNQRWKIVNGAVFQRLMGYCVGGMNEIFDDWFKVGTGEGCVKRPQASSRWSKSQRLVKSYTGALLHFLSELQDPSVTHMLLRHIEKMLPYFAPFPKTCRLLLKATLRVWGGNEDTRVVAFMVIRRMALDLPFPFIELCLKGVYLTFQRNTKFTNHNNVNAQRFMAQCVTELFGLDPVAAYEHAFVYIRHLAMQLRAALVTKSKEALATVGSWQFLNSIRLWGRTLTAYPAENQLRPLHYPFIQVALGAVRLMNSARWAPFRSQICETLVHLAVKGECYIPVAPALLHTLFFPECLRAPKTSQGTPVDLDTTLHLSKAQLGTRIAQDSIVNTTVKQLGLFLAVYSDSVSFPELTVPITNEMRRFAKQTKNTRHRRQIKDFLDKVQRGVSWAQRKRAELDVAPKDLPPLRALTGKGSGKGGKQDISPFAHELQKEIEAAVKPNWGDGGAKKVGFADEKKKNNKQKGKKAADDSEEDEVAEIDDESDAYSDLSDGAGAYGSDESDEEDGVPNRSGNKRKSKGAAADDDDDDEEEDSDIESDDSETKERKAKKKAYRQKKKRARGTVGGTVDADDDVVEELVLSDSD